MTKSWGSENKNDPLWPPASTYFSLQLNKSNQTDSLKNCYKYETYSTKQIGAFLGCGGGGQVV